MRRISVPLAWCAVGVAIIAGMWMLRGVRNADITGVSYALPGGAETGVTLPVYVEGELTRVDFRVAFRADQALGSRYVLTWYGCIRSLSLDGTAVQIDEGSRCSDAAGTRIDFGTAPRNGSHMLSLSMQPAPYARHFVALGSLRPSVASPYAALRIAIAALLVLTLWVAATAWTFPAWSATAWTGYACGLGAVFRLAWAAVMPLGERTPDAAGHLEYLTQMLHAPGIPSPGAGWEAYQPPLYYALSAAWVRLLSIAHAGVPWLDDAQILSLLLSIISLCLAAVCMSLLCGVRPLRTWDAVPCTVLLAVFPGLVMYAPRVSNDVLLQCLAFGFLALLLRWAREPDSRWSWLAVCAAVCAGVLTKSNALVWVAAAMAALCLDRPRPRTALRRLAALLAMLAVFCGWLFVLRFVIQGQSGLVANIGQLSERARVPNTAGALFGLWFPGMLLHPYTHTEQSFVRYLFSSLLFGGYQYPQPLLHAARLAMLGGCAALLAAMFGMALRARQRLHAVMVLALSLLLLSQLAYRVLYPFTYDQDARFSAVLALFLAYGFMRGIRLLPARFQTLGESVFIAYILVSAAFAAGVVAVF